MPVTVRIPPLSVVYKEAYVMQPLYRLVKKWLDENDYVDPKGDASKESAMEILYHYKIGTTVSHNEHELRIWWRTRKQGIPFGSGNSFYTHHIDINWNAIQMYNIEIMHQGKKIKAQKGELIINIVPYIVTPDINSAPIVKFFDNWFRTRLIKKNVEEQKKELYQEAYRLQGLIKKYLELKTFIYEEDIFHEKFEPI